MKKILLGMLGILGIIFLLRSSPHFAKSDVATRGKPNSAKASSGKQITNTNPSPTSHSSLVTSHSLFIPYWSPNIDTSDADYDLYYYFGIAPTVKGEIASDAGLSNMPKVVNSLELIVNSRKKMVLRMLDASVTDALLADVSAQKVLVTNINTILEQNNFSGIVVDLEVSFSFNAEKKGQITQFVQRTCTEIKANYKTCDLLVYGDYAYRGRPYDLGALGRAADKIILMAYDFHKPSGEPGPNYSFNEREKYGYDFKQMITDVTALVPKEKIEVAFGMFGYDWTMNEQGKPLKSATALSVNEIRSRVAQNANRENDTRYTLHENEAKEKSIQYIDSEGRSHIIWYEDEESAEIKTKYLQSVGIGKVSYWAHSYF